MNTINENSKLEIKEAYMSPESEKLEFNFSTAFLVGGSGEGDDWGDGGED